MLFRSYGEMATYLRIQDFVTECEKYRELYNDVFAEMFEILSVDGSLIWQNVIKERNSDLLDELTKENTLGIVSKKRMIMQYYGLSEEDALKELEDIAKEASTTITTDV